MPKLSLRAGVIGIDLFEMQNSFLLELFSSKDRTFLVRLKDRFSLCEPVLQVDQLGPLL